MKKLIIAILVIVVLGLWFKPDFTKDKIATTGSAVKDIAEEQIGEQADKLKERLKEEAINETKEQVREELNTS